MIDALGRRVAEAVGDREQVLLVYLFGSQVAGQTGPLSDLDIAVLLARGAAVPQLRSELASAFSRALDDARVDLIVLNQAPIELAYAVIAQGQAVHERSLADRVEYEADVMSRYGDYLPFLRAQRQLILEGAGDERRVQRYREALGRTQRTLGALGAAQGPPAD